MHLQVIVIWSRGYGSIASEVFLMSSLRQNVHAFSYGTGMQPYVFKHPVGLLFIYNGRSAFHTP